MTKTKLNKLLKELLEKKGNMTVLVIKDSVISFLLQTVHRYPELKDIAEQIEKEDIVREAYTLEDLIDKDYSPFDKPYSGELSPEYRDITLRDIVTKPVTYTVSKTYKDTYEKYKDVVDKISSDLKEKLSSYYAASNGMVL